MDSKQLTWCEAIADAKGTTPHDVAKQIRDLADGVQKMRDRGVEVFPPQNLLYNAFQLTPPGRAKVVILGQDPYHDNGQAMGLSFSVPKGIALPPSLQNIYKELHDDIGCEIPQSGDLTKWAEQGVLLLNSALSVEAHKANSHANYGWNVLTEGAVLACLKIQQPVAFILWGANAQRIVENAMKMMRPEERVAVQEGTKLLVRSPHPSPLSAYRGFFGSKPFSKVNAFLADNNLDSIDWSLA